MDARVRVCVCAQAFPQWRERAELQLPESYNYFLKWRGTNAWFRPEAHRVPRGMHALSTLRVPRGMHALSTLRLCALFSLL